MPDVLLSYVRAGWSDLVGVPVPQGRIDVTVLPGSPLGPPGWTAVLRLGSGAVVTVPTPGTAGRVTPVFAALDPARAADPAVVLPLLSPTAVIGPATLAYADARTARLLPAVGVDAVEGGSGAAQRFLAAVPPDDAAESGLSEMTSPWFVVRRGPEVVSACAYRGFGPFAHLGILTAAGHRGHGHAREVASAAARHAFGAGMVAQWRAGVEPSRVVARALGFRELGAQLNVLPGPPSTP